MTDTADETVIELTFTEQKRRRQHFGIVAMNNPRALNALTLEMFQELGAQTDRVA